MAPTNIQQAPPPTETRSKKKGGGKAKGGTAGTGSPGGASGASAAGRVMPFQFASGFSYTVAHIQMDSTVLEQSLIGIVVLYNGRNHFAPTTRISSGDAGYTIDMLLGMSLQALESSLSLDMAKLDEEQIKAVEELWGAIVNTFLAFGQKEITEATGTTYMTRELPEDIMASLHKLFSIQDSDQDTSPRKVKKKSVYWYTCTTQVPDPNKEDNYIDYGQKFRSRGIRNVHQVRDHGHGDTFDCKQCSEKFTFKSALDRHVNQVHSQSYKYVCTLCTERGSQTHSKDAYNQHMFTKHQIGIPNFWCSNCGQRFTSKDKLTQHMRNCGAAHDSEDAKPQCSICFRTLKNEAKLSSHYRRCHKGNPRVPEKYQKSTGRKKKAEVVFDCNICGKGFATKANLRKHLENVHSEVPEDVSSDRAMVELSRNHFVVKFAASFFEQKASSTTTWGKNTLKRSLMSILTWIAATRTMVVLSLDRKDLLQGRQPGRRPRGQRWRMENNIKWVKLHHRVASPLER